MNHNEDNLRVNSPLEYHALIAYVQWLESQLLEEFNDVQIRVKDMDSTVDNLVNYRDEDEQNEDYNNSRYYNNRIWNELGNQQVLKDEFYDYQNSVLDDIYTVECVLYPNSPVNYRNLYIFEGDE